MSEASETQAPVLLRLAGTMLALSVVSVIIRFWARILMRSKLWWDDWLALASIPVVTICAIVIFWTSIGLRKHAKYVEPRNIRKSLQLLYAGEVIYDIGISLPKLSALFFYARIFGQRKGYRGMLWVTGGLVIGWIIFAVCTAIWQ
ncbi:hypothetical protein DM02DRAFT_546234 [Periconia macrospinosa]|uniref:Rhodopsin domain-containing protein n=1 Tax=Periconia macrospinosa TaxID=97972 RepID=A0A2V1D0U2_9PLEO|nr:hypothetical protein DM02DRAFT_546234 [Periconia macrospinosa]